MPRLEGMHTAVPGNEWMTDHGNMDDSIMRCDDEDHAHSTALAGWLSSTCAQILESAKKKHMPNQACHLSALHAQR